MALSVRVQRLVLAVQYFVRQSRLTHFVKDLEQLIAEFASQSVRWSDIHVGKRGLNRRLCLAGASIPDELTDLAMKYASLMHSTHGCSCSDHDTNHSEPWDIIAVTERQESYNYCLVCADYVCNQSDRISFEVRLLTVNHYFNVGFVEYDLESDKPILGLHKTMNDYLAQSGIHLNIFPEQKKLEFQNAPKMAMLGKPARDDPIKNVMHPSMHLIFTVDMPNERIIVGCIDDSSDSESDETQAIVGWTEIKAKAILFAISCGNSAEIMAIRICDTPHSHFYSK